MTAMQYRSAGNSGLEVSAVGLGCNNFGTTLDLGASQAILDAALDEGITLLDTADCYGASEEFLGKMLGSRRDEVVIATKFGTDLASPVMAPLRGGGAAAYVREAAEASLRRLNTDYIDLYQLHWVDPATPIEETLAALTDLVDAGKVRYIGCSNLVAWQLVEAALTSKAQDLARFVTAQNYYNLLDRGAEAELIPVCERYDLSIIPYFPLAMGMLAGRYRRGAAIPEHSRVGMWGVGHFLTDDRFDVLEQLETFAAERGLTLLEVAIGGLAAQPAVASVIAGASSVDQVRANAKAGAWVPSADDLAALDQASPTQRPQGWSHPVLGAVG